MAVYRAVDKHKLVVVIHACNPRTWEAKSIKRNMSSRPMGFWLYPTSQNTWKINKLLHIIPF